MRKKPQHDCPCCTCGTVKITWSDRHRYVDLVDAAEVVDAILNAALDHSYDRPSDGVPCGFSDETRRRVAPIAIALIEQIDALNDNDEFDKNRDSVVENARLAIQAEIEAIRPENR